MNTTKDLQEEKISTSEQNKKFMRDIIEEIWNKRNLDKVREVASDNFVIHFSREGEELNGPEEVIHFYTHLLGAFPDMKFTVLNQVAEDDKVVTHWTATGTHKGEFKGIPATGKKVNFSAMDIDRIVGGKAAECWTNIDELSLMKQLGVIPEKV